jgi:SAM-dependent methyltransferase
MPAVQSIDYCASRTSAFRVELARIKAYVHKLMLKQWIRRKRKVFRGFVRTYLRRDHKSYHPTSWWDERVYTRGMSDSRTISQDTSLLATKYHYASVELVILRHLRNHNIDLTGAAVLDVGSGAGHWIDFYRSIGAAACVGIDISETSVRFLQKKYAAQEHVQIYHGLFQNILEANPAKFDLINAIGVMFHVVNDPDWEKGLQLLTKNLEVGGTLIIGGYFGLLNNVNVQFDAENSVNKRLRSRMHWMKKLRALGYTKLKIYQNLAYLRIDEPIPECNILVARR